MARRGLLKRSVRKSAPSLKRFPRRFEPLEDRRMLVDPEVSVKSGNFVPQTGWDFYEHNWPHVEGDNGFPYLSIEAGRNITTSAMSVNIFLSGEAKRNVDYYVLDSNLNVTYADPLTVDFAMDAAVSTSYRIHSLVDSQIEGFERIIWELEPGSGYTRKPGYEKGSVFFQDVGQPWNQGRLPRYTHDEYVRGDRFRLPGDAPPQQDCGCGCDCTTDSPVAPNSATKGVPATAAEAFTPRTSGLQLQNDISDTFVSDLTGALTITESVLPGFELIYRSDSVSAPVVTAPFLMPSYYDSDTPAASVKARLRWTDTRIPDNTPGTPEHEYIQSEITLTGSDAWKSYGVAIQGDSTIAALPTGTYGVVLEVAYDGVDYEQFPTTMPGTWNQANLDANVVNRSASEFGKGWYVRGLSSWIARGTNPVQYTYLEGDGDIEFSNSDDGNLTFPYTNSSTVDNHFGERRTYLPLTQNGNQLLQTFIDGKGNETVYTYDTSDRLYQIADPVGNVTAELEYYPTGDSREGLLKRVDRFDGQFAEFDYDSSDRLTKIARGSLSDPDVSTSEFEYDGTTSLVTKVTRGNRLSGVEVTAIEYAAAAIGRVSRTTLPDGEAITHKPQQLLFMGRPNGQNPPLVQPINSAFASRSGSAGAETFQLDRYGYVLIGTDENDVSSQFVRNWNGQVISDAASIGVVPAAGSAVTNMPWQYDSDSLIEKHILADGRMQQWDFDKIVAPTLRPLFVLKQYIDENGNRFDFTYDTYGNRETHSQYVDGSSGDADETDHYYSPNSDYLAGLLEYEIDEMGVRTDYDYYHKDGDIPDSEGPDGNGSDPDFVDFARGRIRKSFTAKGNSTLERWTEYQYAYVDPTNKALGRTETVTELIDKINNVNITRSTKYVYDLHGNLIAEHEPKPSDGTATGPITTHQYDSFNRRIRTVSPDPDGPLGSIVTTYQYDFQGSLIGQYQSSNTVNAQPTVIDDAIPYAVTDADARTEIDLFAIFSDTEDADSALTYSVIDVDNANDDAWQLFDSVSITTDYPRKLVLDYSGSVAKSADVVVRATDTRGKSATTTFNITRTAVTATERRINSTTTSSQVDPAMAVLANGDMVAVWYDSDTAHKGVYARLYDANGNPKVPDPQSPSDPQPEIYVGAANSTLAFPQVIATTNGSETNNGFVVSWWQNESGVFYGYFRRFQADGDAIGTEVQIGQTLDVSQGIYTPRVATIGDTLYFTWPISGDIKLRSYDTSNTASSIVVANQTTANTQSGPSITTVGEKLAVVWEGNGSGDTSGVFARWFDANLDDLSDEFLLNTTTADKQNHVVTADGFFVVAWISTPNLSESAKVYARRYAADGTPASAEILVEENVTFSNTLSHLRPALALTPDGGFVVAWRNSSSTSWDVFLKRFRNNGTPIGSVEPINITVMSGTQDDPTLLVNPAGRLIATLSTGGVGDVYFRIMPNVDDLASASSLNVAAIVPGQTVLGPVDRLVVNFNKEVTSTEVQTGTYSVTGSTAMTVSNPRPLSRRQAILDLARPNQTAPNGLIDPGSYSVSIETASMGPAWTGSFYVAPGIERAPALLTEIPNSGSAPATVDLLSNFSDPATGTKLLNYTVTGVTGSIVQAAYFDATEPAKLRLVYAPGPLSGTATVTVRVTNIFGLSVSDSFSITLTNHNSSTSNTGPFKVIGLEPALHTPAPVDQISLRFSYPVSAANLSGRVTITDPDGTAVTLASSGTYTQLGTAQVAVRLQQAISKIGRYRVKVTPHATALNLDQDGDGTAGETVHDQYGGEFYFGIGDRTDYDSIGRTSKSIDAAGSATSYAYFATGPYDLDQDGTVEANEQLAAYRETTTDALNNETTNYYNLRGELVETKHPAVDSVHPRTTYKYDSVGRLEFTKRYIDATNYSETKNVYDSVTGRLKETWGPDPTSGNASATYKTKYFYDALGRQNIVEDPLGRRRETVYDNAGRVKTTIEPDAATGLTRDPNNSNQETNIIGPRTDYLYDAAGNQWKVTGPDGGNGLARPFTTHEFNRLGQIVKTTHPDPDGAGSLPVSIEEYRYDKAGRLWKHRQPNQLSGLATNTGDDNPAGLETIYVYDKLGRVESMNVGGRVTSYRYDAAGNQVAMTDPLGRISQQITDSFGRSAASIDALGGVSIAGFDAVGQATIQVDSLGRVTTTAYDSNGRVSSVARPNPNGTATAATTTYKYDSLGNLKQEIAPRTYGDPSNTPIIADFVYDKAGRRIQVQQPKALLSDSSRPTTYFHYDVAGQLQRVVDPLSRETGYLYDKAGRLQTLVKPDQSSGDAINDTTLAVIGPATDYVYFSNGLLKKQTDPDPDGGGSKPQSITEYRYDNLGRRTKWIQPNKLSGIATDGSGAIVGYLTEYQYNTLGGLTKQIDPDPDGDPNQYNPATDVQFGYSAFGELTSRVEHAGSTFVGSETYTYDSAGNRVSSFKEEPFYTLTAYDSLNRPVTVTDARDGIVRYTYDPVGNLTSLTDPALNMTTFTYGPGNQKTSETNTLGFIRTFAFDATGNRIQATDRNGQVRFFTYDALNRLTKETWDLATDRELSWTYDAAGQLLTASDPAASYTFSQYDKLGNLKTTNVDYATGPAHNVYQQYDKLGRRTQLSTDDGDDPIVVNNYDYDPLSRMVQIVHWVENLSIGQRVDFVYNNTGRMSSIGRYRDPTGGNTLVATSTFVYDDHGRLDQLTHSKTGVTLEAYDWGYDTRNRITSFLTTNHASENVTTYTYDQTDQLIAADRSGSSNDESYAFDLNGNRTNVGNVNYVTGANNQVIRDGTYEYGYDNEGNRVSRTVLVSNNPTGAKTEYKWDPRNRLTQVVEKNSSGTVLKVFDYLYDLFDRRISKTIDDDGPGSNPAISSFFIFDDRDVVAEQTSTAALKHTYLRGPIVDQVLLDHDFIAGEDYWALSDHQNTVRDVATWTSGTGTTIVQHTNFDSFGRIIGTPPTIFANVAYAGADRDPETGLQIHDRRYYDVQIASWMSPDPIGFGDGPNPYAYVHNDPLNSVDPTGLWAKPDRRRFTGVPSAPAGFDLDYASLPTPPANHARVPKVGPGPVLKVHVSVFVTDYFSGNYLDALQEAQDIYAAYCINITWSAYRIRTPDKVIYAPPETGDETGSLVRIWHPYRKYLRELNVDEWTRGPDLDWYGDHFRQVPTVFFIDDIDVPGLDLGTDRLGIQARDYPFAYVADYVQGIPSYGVTLAHEMGHLFGYDYHDAFGLMADGLPDSSIPPSTLRVIRGSQWLKPQE